MLSNGRYVGFQQALGLFSGILIVKESGTKVNCELCTESFHCHRTSQKEAEIIGGLSLVG